MSKLKSYENEGKADCDPNKRIDGEDIVPPFFAILSEFQEPLDTKDQNDSHSEVYILKDIFRGPSGFLRRPLD